MRLLLAVAFSDKLCYFETMPCFLIQSPKPQKTENRKQKTKKQNLDSSTGQFE